MNTTNKNIDDLIDEYYEKYKGLPSDKPIIRMNQKNDAFEIVVLETLYGDELGIDICNIEPSNIDKISKYIVAPPDDGIDIVVVKEELDETHYDFIQVKNSKLDSLDIKKALRYMEDSISTYKKSHMKVGENLRAILSETGLGDDDSENCRFILVHRGECDSISGQKSNEQIINEKNLELLKDSSFSKLPTVKERVFKSESYDCCCDLASFDKSAIVINLRGKELAELNNEFITTDRGRNMLFGQNLREGLGLGRSKTYIGMTKTINEEPEKFWFYNNGITILADEFRYTKNSIKLYNFSIINGAQTTSSLGRFLKEALQKNDYEKQEDIKKLEKVRVMARILQVKNDNKFKDNIAIFNNTQNPITTRDMASNRDEQRFLHNRLLNENGSSHIFMEIKRGTNLYNNIPFYKHQKTTNEELAQLAFAGFLKNPFIAKDKKKALNAAREK